MTRFARDLGQTAFFAMLGAAVLTVSASGQNYPPQAYPSQPYPSQQPYPAQQSYPARPPYPAQAQPYPAQQPYPARGQASGPPPAQGYPAAQAAPVSSSSICVRLEAQLASLNSGVANSPLAEQIKRDEDAIAKQQAEIDRATERARRVGCANQGFFSLFSGFSPQCGPLNSQIDEMRSKLDRLTSEVEQLKSGNNDQQSQRNVLVGQLAQNNCGAQYTAAARAAGPQGFFEALLGGGTIVNPGGNGGPAGTYRTVCVRTCDGFYFPISYSTVPSRFAADAQACQRLCPAAQVTLYTYHNPGEQIEQAVSADGAPYTALPNAFRYRKEVTSGCSCRTAGETWAQALRNADDSSTLESGDIVVTDKNEKALTRIPPGATKTPTNGAAAKPAATPTPAAQDSGAANKTETDPKKRKVRVVGPQFLSQPDH